MYQVDEQTINRVLDAGQSLYLRLQSSPWFAILKEEPQIMEFVNAYRDLESHIKRQNAEPPSTP